MEGRTGTVKVTAAADARERPGALQRVRPGHRHLGRRPGQDLPAVLHHQEHRQGHRPRPSHLLRHRQDAQRQHLVRLRAGGRHHLPRRDPDDPRKRRKGARNDQQRSARRGAGPGPSCSSTTTATSSPPRPPSSAAAATRCTPRESSDEALDLLETLTPDIIFLDLMMERYDSGFRLAYETAQARAPGRRAARHAERRGPGDRRALRPGGQGLLAWSKLDRFVDKPATGKQLLARGGGTAVMSGGRRRARGPRRHGAGAVAAPARILVVDDEYGVRSAVRQILELEGYEVEERRHRRGGSRAPREPPTSTSPCSTTACPTPTAWPLHRRSRPPASS